LLDCRRIDATYEELFDHFSQVEGDLFDERSGGRMPPGGD
jgi:hypothetical protein